MAVATAVVLLGGSIAPFLAPPVVRFEQDRTGVQQLTGLPADVLDRVTASLLGDLVLWQGDFAVGTTDSPVLDMLDDVLSSPERAHMRDVRNVFTGFWLLVLAGVAVLAIGFRRAHAGTEARAAAWLSVASGARGLAVAITIAGVITVVAFDAAFEVFHRLFFSSGSYTFDPARDRLVQLFPERFWSEISIAVGVVVLLASIVTWWVARRRAARIGGVSA
jgi:integral membrane protein (TIGR01906 family)